MTPLSSEFIDIIEWTDDSRETLSYRFPDEDRAIKRGAQLIVRESQAAQFVYLGQYGDTFGPGKHRLTTDNIPILSRIKGWKYGFESPFKADVYYVTTRLFTGNQWGTANPIMLRDPDLDVVRVRAFGTYDFRVRDAKRFLGEVAGTDDRFTLDDFSTAMRSRIVSVFTRRAGEQQDPGARRGDPLHRAGQGAAAADQSRAAGKVRRGDVELRRRERLGAARSGAGHRQAREHVGREGSERLREVSDGAGFEKGAVGAGGVGAEMAVGMSVAQQLLNQQAAAAPRGISAVLSPDEVAKMLKVPEADVIMSLESGDLKGKKIGSQWRVTQAAVDQFLG